jgi:hypothetical protein
VTRSLTNGGAANMKAEWIALSTGLHKVLWIRSAEILGKRRSVR